MNNFVALPQILQKRAQEDPDRIYATEVAGRTMTFGEIWESSRLWGAVLAQHQVTAGDRVLVMQPTSIASFEIWMGAAVLNAIEVPINTQYMGDLLTHVVNNSEAEVMVCEERYLDVVLAEKDKFSHLRTIIVNGEVKESDAGDITLVAAAPLLAAAKPLTEIAEPQPWDIGTIIYTSGTTGPSKGVLTPWAQIQESTVGMAPEHAFRAAETVVYMPYPMFHVSGKGGFTATLLGGGRVVVRERFSTDDFWSDIREHGCTATLLMGATANFIYRQPETPEDATTPLKHVMFSPWIPEVEGFKKRFDVEACTNFNMTEISCPIVAGWDNETITNPESCGKARDGFQLRIVDEHDREVPVGTIGELVIRSDEPWKIMAGYWKMPEKTVEAWQNQWFHTGDLFTVDAEGNYTWVDRKKDSIRRRGENISSQEIEQQVLAHPAVLEVAAVAVPDDISGEEVKVVLCLKPGQQVTEAELAEFLTGRLPRFMVPRYVEILEALPKTPTQKIRKVDLRKDGVTAGTWDRMA